jgi:hypothetical protein
MKTKQSVHKKYSIVGWFFLVILLIFLFLFGFFFIRNANRTPSDGSTGSGTSSSTVTPASQSDTKQTETQSNSQTEKDKPPIVPEKNDNVSTRKKIDTHIVPSEPIEIEIPTPPLGDVEAVPDYNQLLRLNDLQKSFDSLSTYLEELEEEFKNNPSDKELQELIRETKKELDRITEERESILNGDF